MLSKCTLCKYLYTLNGNAHAKALRELVKRKRCRHGTAPSEARTRPPSAAAAALPSSADGRPARRQRSSTAAHRPARASPPGSTPASCRAWRSSPADGDCRSSYIPMHTVVFAKAGKGLEIAKKEKAGAKPAEGGSASGMDLERLRARANSSGKTLQEVAAEGTRQDRRSGRPGK